MTSGDPGPAKDTRCPFFKIPLELRDNVYDYVAWEEKNLSLHINLETVTEPKVHAYDQGLSQTCTQLRHEYSARLRQRIKQLETDYQGWHRAAPPRPRGGPPICGTRRSQTILIAERKVSKGVWTQDAVAVRTVVPFPTVFDHIPQLSKLTFTVASSADRAYNREIKVKFNHSAREKPDWDLVYAMESIELMQKAAALNSRNWWMRWWVQYITHGYYPYY